MRLEVILNIVYVLLLVFLSLYNWHFAVKSRTKSRSALFGFASGACFITALYRFLRLMAILWVTI